MMGDWKEEIVTSHYTFSTPVWKMNMCSGQTACFRDLCISLKYRSVSSSPWAATNIPSLPAQMHLTHPADLSSLILVLWFPGYIQLWFCNAATQSLAWKSHGYQRGAILSFTALTDFHDQNSRREEMHFEWNKNLAQIESKCTTHLEGHALFPCPAQKLSHPSWQDGVPMCLMSFWKQTDTWETTCPNIKRAHPMSECILHVCHSLGLPKVNDICKPFD